MKEGWVIKLAPAWNHVWVRPHRTDAPFVLSSGKVNEYEFPNHGECSQCGREATYLAKYPNGTMAEYCQLHAWVEPADYLYGNTGEKMFELARHTKWQYVERLEYVEDDEKVRILNSL